MLVVRRTFRGPHGIMSVGSVVEPTGIRKFKYHIQERHIVEITEQNFKQYAKLFKVRFGLDLKCIQEDYQQKKAKEEAEAKAKEEAEAKAKEEAEAKAKEEAEAKAKESAVPTVKAIIK